MQAQAQCVKEKAVTAQESMVLAKVLVRVAIHHVSYLRGLFPDNNYQKVPMRNLDNIEAYMLAPKCEEAKRLHDWVHGGVADALERRYLRKLFFGFSRDKDGKDLLEEYVFTFSYDDNGDVHMSAGTSSKHKFSTRDAPSARRKGPTLSQVKYQIVRLMRMLVEVTNTLEQVPDERYLFMKMTYTDDTPEEYEPPMFGPAPDGGVGCFSRMPFIMEVGKMQGKDLQLGLVVKSLLDNLDSDWEEDNVPVADDNSNLFQLTSAVNPSAAVQDHKQDSDVKVGPVGGAISCAGRHEGVKYNSPTKDGGEVCPQQEIAAAAQGAAEAAVAAPTEPSSARLKEVQDWILARPLSQVHVLDALARFSHIPSFDIDACFAALQRHGLLVPTPEDADNYSVMKPEVTAEVEIMPPSALPAKTAPPAAAATTALLEAEEAMERLHVGMDSQQGGLHDMPGSQRTQSVAGKRKCQPAESDGAQAEQMLFPDTQQASQAGAKRQKKASFVQKPIAQGQARRQRKAPAAGVVEADTMQRRRSTRNMR